MNAQLQEIDSEAAISRAAATLGIAETALVERATSVFVSHRAAGASLRRFIYKYALAVLLNAEAARTIAR